MKSLAPVQGQPKGLQILVKHWFINYQFPHKVYEDLRRILKQESIWFAAYLNLNNNNRSKTQEPDENTINSLTKKRILKVRESILNNKFSWVKVKKVWKPKSIVGVGEKNTTPFKAKKKS